MTAAELFDIEQKYLCTKRSLARAEYIKSGVGEAEVIVHFIRKDFASNAQEAFSLPAHYSLDFFTQVIACLQKEAMNARATLKKHNIDPDA